ncbi:MAG: hypothetical protein ACI8W8_002111 [Rhodothermales bacterium]
MTACRRSAREVVEGQATVALAGFGQGPPFIFRDDETLVHPIEKVLGSSWRVANGGALQTRFEVPDLGFVYLWSELLRERNFANQVAAQAGATAGQRCIVVIHEGVDLAEEIGEGAGRLRAASANGDPPVGEFVEDHTQVEQIKFVLQALTPGLEEDRKVAERHHGLEELLGAQTIEPQRETLSKAGPSEQEGASGCFAKSAAEEGGLLQLAAQQTLKTHGRDRGKDACDVRIMRHQGDDNVVVGPGVESATVCGLPGGGNGKGKWTIDASAPVGVENDLGLIAAPGTFTNFDEQVMPMRESPASESLLLAQKANKLIARGSVHILAEFAHK